MRWLRATLARSTCFIGILAMIGGCAVGPDFHRPAPPATNRYTVDPLPPVTVAADGGMQRFDGKETMNSNWWQLFKSAPLDAVVREALANNPDTAVVRGQPESESAQPTRRLRRLLPAGRGRRQMRSESVSRRCRGA